MAKWVGADRRRPRARVRERARSTRDAGPPGPVVLALPEDMLVQTAAVADAVCATSRCRRIPAPPTCDRACARCSPGRAPDRDRRRQRLDEHACADLQRFAEANWAAGGLRVPLPGPVRQPAPELRRRRRHRHQPEARARIKRGRLVLAIGPRLGEMTTGGYTLLESPRAGAEAGARARGRRGTRPRLPGRSADQRRHAADRFAALAAMPPVDAARWRDWTRAARADYRAWTARRENPGRVQMWEIVDGCAAAAGGRDPANGAGNFSGWFHRFYRHPGFRTQLAPTSGAMGYGVPAAIAARSPRPERTVLAINRRRRFPDERAGARHRGAVRRRGDLPGDQQRHVRHDPHAPGARLPGRVYGTELRNPDFAAYARAFGAHGETVCATAEFARSSAASR
jgi:acetolactate synthase-1/2/3 large subunit